METALNYNCPVCQKVIPSLSTASDGKKVINAPFFPFCSERCRLIDLGAWLDEQYAIPSVQQSVEDDLSES